MHDFSVWQHDFLLLRPELEQTLSVEQSDFTVAEKQLSKLHACLRSGLDFAVDSERYGNFLQEQLDWLNQTIAVLSQQKEAMATDLLQLERRKKARARYNQHT